MRIDIMTLFPDTVNAVLHESIIGRAAAKGILEINCHQIRDYTENKQNQVDDYPYGGGWGCVMMAQPLKSCLDHIKSETEGCRTRVIYMSPQGQPYNQETAKRLKRDYDHLVLVCGHYEGIDERFIESCVDEEISLGDFVLTGGEIAAMAVADSVGRLIPGVLSDEQCYIGESHWDGLLEYPQYTRPEVWEGREVPEVLLNGDHAKILQWRHKKQLERTMKKRPDMFEKLEFTTKEDKALLASIRKDAERITLTAPILCRKAEKEDLDVIMQIVADARASLKAYHVDQWQAEYPTRGVFEEDMERGECYVLTHNDEVAAVFTLSVLEEPSYSSITDGKWTPDVSYTVLHRSAVLGKYRSTGVAEQMMKHVERLTSELGRKAIRVDTHKKNKPMLNLMKGAGYRYRGNIIWDCGDGHDPARQAFEKILKKQSR